MYKKDAYYVGESFRLSACKMLPDDVFDENDDGMWFVPYIVNVAFSCELYLKSLISNGENEIHGHKLEELFDKLDNRLKNIILSAPNFKGDEDFKKNLADASNAFVEWRYCFEHKEKALDFIFLDNFADVTRDLAQKELERMYNIQI